jgi:cytochrome c-type biogenesis protein CcmH/NrfG
VTAARPDDADAANAAGTPDVGAPDVEADERRESLEAERDFLLRSLDDLDATRAAGDIDDATYDRLHADYTARAAAVLRVLRDGVDARPEPKPPSNHRRVAAIAGIVAFAVAASVALAAGLGARLPGQSATGNSPARSESQGAALRAAVNRSPGDPQAHLTYARYLIGTRDFAGALKEYDTTARLDPKNAESRAYSGWIVYLAGLPDEAMKRLDAAVVADPAYPDARFFRGMVLMRGKNDACRAVPEFQRYLAVANQSPMGPQVNQELQAALKACPRK